MPVRGDVFFLSGENRKSFDIDVLSDSISEGPEVCLIKFGITLFINFLLLGYHSDPNFSCYFWSWHSSYWIS